MKRIKRVSRIRRFASLVGLALSVLKSIIAERLAEYQRRRTRTEAARAETEAQAALVGPEGDGQEPQLTGPSSALCRLVSVGKTLADNVPRQLS